MNTAYSIVSSDCSIRSDLDASFDSRARYRDSDNDSLSYSDDSSHGGFDSYGWYTDGGEGDDSGVDEKDGALFF